MIQVMIWSTPQANLTEEKRQELTVDMRALCEGIPIIKVQTEKMEEELFNQRMETLENCSVWTGQTGRKKRAIQALHSKATCSTTGGPPPNDGTIWLEEVIIRGK